MNRDEAENRRTIWKHAGAAFLYLVISCVLMWPVLGQVSRQVVGSADFHVWDHVWHCWWARHSIEHGVLPFFSSLLDFPRGVHIAGEMSTLTFPFLSVPLQYVLGLVGAYNALGLASFALAAFGAYLVCHRCVPSAAACILGGTMYGFSPFLQVELSNGMMEQVVGAAILPFFVLTLLSINDCPRRRTVAVASVLVALLALSSLYSVIFAFLLMPFFLHPKWKEAQAADRKRLLTAYGIVALVGVVVLAGVAGGVALTSGTLTRHGNWKGCALHPIMRNKVCVDALRLFSASAGSGCATTDGTMTLVPFGVYMGKIAVFLSAAALLTRNRAWRPWKIGLMVAIFLAMGPYLNIGGRIETASGVRIPLPSRFVLAVFPQATRLLSSHNYRFISIAMLFAGLMSAAVLANVFRRLRLRAVPRGLIVLALCCFTVVDFGSSAGRQNPLALPCAVADIPAAYDSIAGREKGGVFDVPLPLSQISCIGLNGRQMFYQTRHGRPIWAGGADVSKPEKLDLALVRAARLMAVGQEWSLQDKELERDAAALSRVGYRYLAMHRDLLSEKDRARFGDLVARCLGGPVADADGVAIYELPSDNDSK